MRTNLILLTACTLLFIACSSHTKKIIVYANNEAVIDEAAKTVTQKDTVGHLDKTIEYSGSDKIALSVKTFAGSAINVEIPEDGYYIANLKAKDTIIGGFQKYSTPQEANRVMSQEDLAHNIDSLQQMIQGTNVSAANHTFFILPNTAAKITANTKATIVGPYRRMTSIEKEGDKEPEVYRFYSITEVREMVDKLIKLTK
ncbi:MAG: hypothetical protein ABI921_00010 [Panacibacter sp.]